MSRDHALRAPGTVESSDAPTPMDLLGVEHAFTQSRPLDARSFADAATERGVRIDVSDLELLHRRGLLVPLFWLHARPVAPASMSRPSESSWFSATSIFQAHAEGRLRDPHGRRFRAWPMDLRRHGPRYSHFQLLAVRALATHLSPGVLAPTSPRAASSRVIKDYVEMARSSLDRTRALACALEVLAPRYLPHVVGQLNDPGGVAMDDLTEFIDARDPCPDHRMVRAVGHSQLLSQAEALLAQARHFDPLGEWARVVRIGAPRRSRDLRFAALLAHEYRIAAELMLRFLEDEHDNGRSDIPSDTSPRIHQLRKRRLLTNPRDRAETIMDFRLSDRPAVCIAVEGATEALLVTRILDLYGFDHRSSWVSVIDREGTKADVKLLARSVAVPRIDLVEERPDLRILSPLTALIVVNDPEGDYASAEGRARVMEAIRSSVLESLPEPIRTKVDPGDLDHVLHVEAWDEEFEFGHFSNTELARAIRRTTKNVPLDEKALRTALDKCRTAGGTVKSVWSKWQYEPSKVRLAEALWPTLKRRIENPNTRRLIPARDLVEGALRIAEDVRIAGVMRSRP